MKLTSPDRVSTQKHLLPSPRIHRGKLVDFTDIEGKVKKRKKSDGKKSTKSKKKVSVTTNILKNVLGKLE